MKFIELIIKLPTIASTNERIEFLKEFFWVDEDNHLLRLYADPDKVFYFSKKQIKNALLREKVDSLFTLNLEYTLDELLNKLSSRELSGHDAEIAYKKFVDKATVEEIEILNTIITKKPIGANLSLINKAHKQLFGHNFIKVFKCQLANKYDPDKKYKTNTWYISPKLDGLRCLYRDGKLYTRQNKPIIGFDHLEQEMKLLSNKYNLELIDGELYSHDIPFHEIQGAVTRNKNINEEDKKKIKFNIFALNNFKIDTTHEMVHLLYNIDRDNELKYIEIVEQEFIKNDPIAIKYKTEEYIKQGYEGGMLRDSEKFYDYKRSNALLKVKFFKEMDCIITDIFEGEGKYEGLLGGFHVASTDNKITAKVGTGFSDEQRKEFYTTQMEYFNTITDIANKYINDPVKVRNLINECELENLIGKKAEIKYFEITPDNSLRFPVFLKLKEDR